MGDLIFFLLLSGGGALALAAAYGLFELSILIAYKITGGRLDLVSFIKNL
jgi:hypothetical protein